MGQWQPIETAPRDGTHVLTYSVVMGHGYIDIAYYQQRTDKPDDARRWIRVGSGEPTCGLSGGITIGGATHWQPLPEPPQAN